jgi:hypothetical protein
LQSNEKSEAENTDSSQDVKDAKTDASVENSVDKKEENSKAKEGSKEASDEPDKKADSSKTATDKAENSKSDVKTSDKKEDKSKAKEEDDDENSEQEDEGSDKGGDEDKEVPLLDQPLEKSGKRERKNVQRFNDEYPAETKDVSNLLSNDVSALMCKKMFKIEFPNGSGIALGNIPRIDASISRFKNDDMKLFHKILFRNQGKSTMIKKKHQEIQRFRV